MKKFTILQLLLTICLLADITLTLEQEKNWQIQSALAKEVDYTPLGEYMISVKTPPNLLYTISLPYEAQVVKLNKVTYDRVKEDDVLATLSASEWIEAQKNAIANSIELIHDQNEAKRKSQLCEEDIIAKKECITADSKVKADMIKLSASKTLLRAYGANDDMLEAILKKSDIFANIDLVSNIEGTILEVNIQTGKSISAQSAIFVIKKDGQNWIESDLPQEIAQKLKPAQEVILKVDTKDIKMRVLHVAPVINRHNQTRTLRFAISKEDNMPAGLRTKGRLFIKEKAFAVDKKAIVQEGSTNLIFLKEGLTYKVKEVYTISEDKDKCYLRYDPKLINAHIVTKSTGILQNMLQKGE